MSNANIFDKNPGLNDFENQIKPYLNFDNIKCVFEFGSRDACESIYFENIFKNASIYAFEPNPDQHIICLNNCKKGETTRVIVEKLALSDKQGQLDFYITPGNIGASSLLKPHFVPWTHDQRYIKSTVQTTTLDIFCQKYDLVPDVIWMDVQGNELNTLKGGDSILNQVSVIYTEAGVIPYYDGHTMKSDIVEYLKKFNFEVVDDKLDWSHESNVIFVKKQLLNK